jgi:hypothetical protein
LLIQGNPELTSIKGIIILKKIRSLIIFHNSIPLLEKWMEELSSLHGMTEITLKREKLDLGTYINFSPNY